MLQQQQQEQQQQQQAQHTKTIEKVMQQEKRKKRPTNLPIASIESLKPQNNKTTNKILQNLEKTTTTTTQMTLNNRNDTYLDNSRENQTNSNENVLKADQAKQIDLVDEVAVANVKENVPLFPSVTKPSIQHDYQLASVESIIMIENYVNNNNNDNRQSIQPQTKETKVVNKKNKLIIPKVLNKPEYAWLIEATAAEKVEKVKNATATKRCKSFSFVKDTEKIADIEKNIKNRVANVVALFDTITKSKQATTTTINMRNSQIRHSFNCLHQPRQQVQLSTNITNTTTTAANTSCMDSTTTTTTTTTLNTSFNLSSHSEALLRTRIPGNTIYYV